MSDREVIQNYIDEQYGGLNPKYYDMRRDYIMEYSWIHWACEEVLMYLALIPNMSAKEVLYLLNDELVTESFLAKSQKAKMIFETGIHIVSELISLIN